MTLLRLLRQARLADLALVLHLMLKTWLANLPPLVIQPQARLAVLGLVLHLVLKARLADLDLVLHLVSKTWLANLAHLVPQKTRCRKSFKLLATAENLFCWFFTCRGARRGLVPSIVHEFSKTLFGTTQRVNETF